MSETTLLDLMTPRKFESFDAADLIRVRDKYLAKAAERRANNKTVAAEACDRLAAKFDAELRIRAQHTDPDHGGRG